ncbi:MAG: hypothetical protein ACYTXA_16335 [Nostoc sp.]
MVKQDMEELDNLLDSIFDERTQPQFVPVFPDFERDYIENLIAKYQKPTKNNPNLKPQTRKLKESPQGSGNYE